jgi:uncharacterized membrane protein
MVTIVLGVGVTRGWPATLFGAGVSLALLVSIIAILGPALTMVPIDVLRATVGILLLLFAVQWLRKGIVRVSRYGFRARPSRTDYRDRTEIIKRSGFDWAAFVLAFKGVLLEGLEVAFIVVTFGAATNAVGVAVTGAASAFVFVVAIALLVRRTLEEIPDHVIKLGVGLLLTTFGTFWAAEGLGVEWPGEDLAILYLLCLYILYALITVSLLRRIRPTQGSSQTAE